MQYLQPNTLLQGGKYKIVRFLSSGGFGNTYEAELCMIHKRVAIKEFFVKNFCNRDSETSQVSVSTSSNQQLVNKLKQKFIDEAASIWQFNHPNIVRVTDVFEENGTAYYVMDYINGISLHSMLKRDGALYEEKAIRYIKQVADALQYVHSQNRLHLDIKPGNIMVDANDNAILIDFGASKQYDEQGENTSTLLGLNTIGYAPVEQMSRSFSDFNPSADVYALGATLYKLLTNITPKDSVLLMTGDEELSPLPSSVSQAVRNAVSKAMTLIRADRPQTIDVFLGLLDSKITNSFDDEVTMCEETEKARQAEEKCRLTEEQKLKEDEARRDAEEEARRKAEEEQKRKAEEQKRNTAKKSSSKNAWLWIVIGVIAVVGIIIVVNSNGNSSDSGNSKQTGGAIQSGNNTLSQQIFSKTYTANGVSFDMMMVKAGTFTMGATSEMEDPDSGEKPAHQVTLTNDYYIGKTEVTQALWKAVMGNNPSYFKGDNLPVENVSWDDCQKFISKINSLTGQNLRLPTEAEWEFAARGGNNSNHYQYSGSNELGDVAWYYGNSGDKTHVVATKQPNELGLYDMSGNVWEWCSDWHGNYSSSSQTNPTGPNSGSYRATRGGSWYNYARICRSSDRGASAPDFSGFDLGLRLVLVP